MKKRIEAMIIRWIERGSEVEVLGEMIESLMTEAFAECRTTAEYVQAAVDEEYAVLTERRYRSLDWNLDDVGDDVEGA